MFQQLHLVRQHQTHLLRLLTTLPQTASTHSSTAVTRSVNCVPMSRNCGQLSVTNSRKTWLAGWLALHSSSSSRRAFITWRISTHEVNLVTQVLGMAHVDFIDDTVLPAPCTPARTLPAFAFLSKAGTHLPTPERDGRLSWPNSTRAFIRWDRICVRLIVVKSSTQSPTFLQDLTATLAQQTWLSVDWYCQSHF